METGWVKNKKERKKDKEAQYRLLVGKKDKGLEKINVIPRP